MNATKQKSKNKYINPYLGGVILGLVLIAANFISGRGLGASGAIKSAVVATKRHVIALKILRFGFSTLIILNFL